MNRISEDVSHVRMYLGPGVMYSINLVVLFTLVVYQMIRYITSTDGSRIGPLTYYVLPYL